MKKLLIFLSFLLSGITGIAQHVILTPTPQGYWNLNGNVTGASNWLGSSNSQPLIFKTNNTERFRIGSAGTFSFNTYSVNFGTGGTVLYTTGASSLYVPYTGATGSVNLGANSFSVGGTSTLTGNVTTSSITSTGNLDLGAATGSVVSLKSASSNIAQFSSSSGFLPNKTRVGSFTTPSATLDVTGTMSVSGTSTLTGIQNNGQLSMTGRLITTGSGSIQIASNTNQIGNLNLNSSTAATLTTGNTGTVAVLSDAVFPVTFIHGATNIADATTYYFGNSGYLLSVAASSGSITIPYNCTLVGWDYNAVVAGVIGTSETSTLSINGSTTNYTLSSSITYSAAGAYQGFSGTGLSQNFVAGERINAKLFTGSFGTNPTAVYGGLTLWFVRRQ